MEDIGSEKGCCSCGGEGKSICRIEALLSVDERGQMVLPKEIRERANIKAGDKLALISWERQNEICCMVLIKADSLGEQIREFLGPIMRDMA
ncbi:MAG TPA: HgcAB-associated protein [Syntrophorhabdaceae bacterium]|nr:HgcAB-associated protein [Syntrophorhabdaceae bacterium]